MVKKNGYEYSIDGLLVNITRDGRPFLSVPAAASVNGNVSELALSRADENAAVFTSDSGEMNFTFFDDCVVVSYELRFAEDTPIYETKIFKSANEGIGLVDFDRAFSPQPRNNKGRNMDYFHHLPDLSMSGYFTPPAFNFSIGSKVGWVSFGLLDIPDTYICKMDDDLSFLVESCGGNKVVKAGETYRPPRVLITFPENELAALPLFRQKLIDFGEYTPKKPKRSELPEWWNAPLVCTYGDQMLENIVGAVIDEAWVNSFVDTAEKEWGLSNFNLVIDDSWQILFTFEPKADSARFPNFRKFIDSMHERGHRVILWCTPMFDNAAAGFVSRSQRLGVLSDYCYAEHDPKGYFAMYGGENSCAIDYTADNARQFVREFCEVLFGSGEGQYNADGVKFDGMASLRDPEQTASYSHPERGIGATELRLFYEMFYSEAKKVKPDALIDCSAGDPRFEQYIDLNRLHDSHCGTREKELRAQISALACPDMSIDSDGALMYASWAKTHYISAAVYSVPALYYLDQFHDKLDGNWKGLYADKHKRKQVFTPEEKKQLGRLLSLSRHRPNGTPVMERFGEWVLKDGDRVNAATDNGETVVFYPTEESELGYLFTWQDEAIFLPLHGRRFSALEPADKVFRCQPDYARDRVLLQLTPGIIYTFRDEDDGRSIDRSFSEGRYTEAEKYVNYVNT